MTEELAPKETDLPVIDMSDAFETMDQIDFGEHIEDEYEGKSVHLQVKVNYKKGGMQGTRLKNFLSRGSIEPNQRRSATIIGTEKQKEEAIASETLGNALGSGVKWEFPEEDK